MIAKSYMYDERIAEYIDKSLKEDLLSECHIEVEWSDGYTPNGASGR